MEKVQNTQQIQSPSFRGQHSSSDPIHDNTARDIKDGDRKSMEILKAAGIIAAGALAVAGVVKLAKSGKGKEVIDKAKNVVKKDSSKAGKAGKKATDKAKDKVAKLEVLKNQKGKIVEQRINGKVLTFEVNKYLVKEFESMISFVESKGYNIVKIDDLLKE